MKMLAVVVPLLSLLLLSCAVAASRPDVQTKTALAVTGETEGNRPSSERNLIRQIGAATGTSETVAIRSQQETNELYGYVYDRGTRVRIESARISPKVTSGGEFADVILTYIVLSHSDEAVQVTETREVWFKNVMLESMQIQTERTGGTYRSSLQLYLPPNAEKGKYKVVFIVQTPYSRDLREAAFTVNGD